MKKIGNGTLDRPGVKKKARNRVMVMDKELRVRTTPPLLQDKWVF
jgi:hypothetical protein